MDERPGCGPAPAPVPATTLHPRRPPAHKSVSLRHSPPASLDRHYTTLTTSPRHNTCTTSPNDPASDKANPPSTISPRLHLHNTSSGESSDAAGWFERTNNEACHDASFVDTDPPFLLHNSSSEEHTPPNGQSSIMGAGMPSLPYRHGLHLGTDGSSNDDFRSVIDDLTVANKKLKQRLRKYEKVYDAHLQEEKLFEVRFHHLPHHKKKELEETLRKFAAGIDDSSDRPDISYVPGLTKDATTSSASRFAESGYASMSASGQNSSTPSNNTSNHHTESRRMTKSAYNRYQQSILRDVPRGLLPQHNVPMSDKATKKMAVRRLEQIFAGKRSPSGGNAHPLQQEEVAQSAATADRREREATGQGLRPEGLRTALIMPDPDADADQGQGEPTRHIPRQQRVNEQDFAAPASGAGSPDQRPTRPLDLDPYRAQVPAANMDYFRHLGFSPPDMMTASAASEDGHGWLYLNLLINMAQLHTLNVTPDNVKDALAEYSTQFEISSDGRKVRWKGGHDFSKNSSDSSPERLGVDSLYEAAAARRSPQKGSKTGNSASTESGYGGSEHQSRHVDANKFAYKPLFFRRDSSESDQDVFDPTESASSLFHAQRGDSSGPVNLAVQSNTSNKRRDDGSMIFYNRAKFCTDLTGDGVGASLTLPENYKTITSHPLGAKLNTESSNGSEIGERRGLLDDTAMDMDPAGGNQTPSTGESLGFSPDGLQNHSGKESPNLMDFEASGLGGVQPDDNFSIRVQRSQIPTVSPEFQSTRRRSSLYPSKIQAILGDDAKSHDVRRRSSSNKNTIKEEMISAVRQDMPSSVLPPPSFFPFDSVSSGEISDDEDESSSNDSDTNDGPSTTLQLLNIAPPGARFESERRSGGTSEASEYSEDEDDDSSIDLLATARQQDPDGVRAFEREYDGAVADRLAEDIVAGSSAATAGGGSGFNSPASGSFKHRRSTQQAQSSTGSLSPRSKNLKRARTSESIATVSKDGSKASKSQRTE